MTKKHVKSKIISDSESEYSSNIDKKEEEKPKAKKHQCPKCGLQFLSLKRHKRCNPVHSKPSNSTSEHNFGNNLNFYRALYIFIHENDISLTITLKAFEKIIQSEIQKVIDQEIYTQSLLLKYKEIKLKEVEIFNEHFVEYYNDQRENDEETESASIEDINADLDEKRRIVYNKIKQLRRSRERNGKMCKSCYNIFSQLHSHVFYDASCKEFIQSIMNEESYFKKRGLIYNQLKYVYRVKFRETKLPRLFRFIDSCYDKFADCKDDEFIKLKKILKLLGNRITKNDY